MAIAAVHPQTATQFGVLGLQTGILGLQAGKFRLQTGILGLQPFYFCFQILKRLSREVVVNAC